MSKSPNVFARLFTKVKSYAWWGIGIVFFGWFLWPFEEGITVGEWSNESASHFRQEPVMDVLSGFNHSSMSKMQSKKEAAAPMALGRLAPVSIAQADDGVAPEVTDRKIVKNASLNLEVSDTEESKILAEAEVKTLKGFVTNQNSWEVRPRILAYNMTVRVPAENLEKLIKNLEKIGIKKSENYSTSDITAAYADTQAEIKILEASRDTLRGLMEKKSDELTDYLKIYQELTRVQTRIDQLTRMQKKRDEQVTYSTLQLTIHPEPQIGDLVSPEWNVGKSWKLAVNDLWKFSQKLADKLIYIGVFSPIWITFLIFVWLGRRFWKKR
jgi:hypothetical protein